MQLDGECESVMGASADTVFVGRRDFGGRLPPVESESDGDPFLKRNVSDLDHAPEGFTVVVEKEGFEKQV